MKFPLLIKNLFSDKELKELQQYAENIFSQSKQVDITTLTWDQIYNEVTDVQVDKYMGRVQLSLPPHRYPQYFVDRLNSAAKQLDPNCEIRYFSFVKYSLDYGYPQLMPHMDNPKKESFLFDIQLSSSIPWPLVVDGEEYTLNDNEVLVIDVQRQVHWRKPTKFKEGDFVYMMFVSFSNENLELPNESEQQEKASRYRANYHKELAEVYPDNYGGTDGSKWKSIRKK